MKFVTISLTIMPCGAATATRRAPAAGRVRARTARLDQPARALHVGSRSAGPPRDRRWQTPARGECSVSGAGLRPTARRVSVAGGLRRSTSPVPPAGDPLAVLPRRMPCLARRPSADPRCEPFRPTTSRPPGGCWQPGTPRTDGPSPAGPGVRGPGARGSGSRGRGGSRGDRRGRGGGRRGHRLPARAAEAGGDLGPERLGRVGRAGGHRRRDRARPLRRRWTEWVAQGRDAHYVLVPAATQRWSTRGSGSASASSTCTASARCRTRRPTGRRRDGPARSRRRPTCRCSRGSTSTPEAPGAGPDLLGRVGPVARGVCDRVARDHRRAGVVAPGRRGGRDGRRLGDRLGADRAEHPHRAARPEHAGFLAFAAGLPGGSRPRRGRAPAGPSWPGRPRRLHQRGHRLAGDQPAVVPHLATARAPPVFLRLHRHLGY